MANEPRGANPSGTSYPGQVRSQSEPCCDDDLANCALECGEKDLSEPRQFQENQEGTAAVEGFNPGQVRTVWVRAAGSARLALAGCARLPGYLLRGMRGCLALLRVQGMPGMFPPFI
jgi:hypothetical protein